MKLKVKTSQGFYEILFGHGILNQAHEFFKLNRRVMIVTDSGIPKEYVETLKIQCKTPSVFTFEQGEKSKNFETYKQILLALTENNFTRKDCIVALGGGVAGDMAGFAAATYMRGIDFYNIPTTVLSQVDSSVGGKTAIDFEGYKNLVGAFYPPKAVLIDFDVLKTLPQRQVNNGICEAIKMAATFDSELFELFESGNVSADIFIPRAVKIKIDVVEKDENETSLRRVLNFGHTLGHAIEKKELENGMLHGECVALGMVLVTKGEVKNRLVNTLKKYNLPTEYKGDVNALYEAITHDKKAHGESVTFITCSDIGRFEMKDKTFSEIKSMLKGE